MLDQRQIDSFHAQGFLVMRGLIRDRELELLRAAADAVVGEGIAGRGSDHLYAPRADGSQLYFRSERMWDRDPIFGAVTVNPALLENIGQCTGRPFFPWNDSLVVKVPHEGRAVGWHQDPPYGDRERTSVYPVPNFTTDIYLDHATRANGCVWAIPGHHLVGHVDLACGDEALFAHPQAVAIEMAPGDVLFHCLSTPHGSRVNPTPTLRRTFYVHYLAQEVYADAYGSYDWSRAKPGWGDAKRVQIAAMRAARARLGLAGECPRVVDIGEGLEVRADAITPVNHWSSLAARWSPAERADLKALRQRSAAAAPAR